MRSYEAFSLPAVSFFFKPEAKVYLSSRSLHVGLRLVRKIRDCRDRPSVPMMMSEQPAKTIKRWPADRLFISWKACGIETLAWFLFMARTGKRHAPYEKKGPRQVSYAAHGRLIHFFVFLPAVNQLTTHGRLMTKKCSCRAVNCQPSFLSSSS